ncbi:MAG: metal ABC transporter permease [Candidatus Omnitrophica bacterium]|nr:metal ABC transporter permease [Candidatus Omnitrophota bacterium]
MTTGFWSVMLLPFIACLVLTGIHAYLGLHVIERGIIFVDLALAQIAALGAGFSLLLHHEFQGPIAYWFSLGFTVIGAAVFSLTRFRRQKLPQEAVIGIVYAVSAALLVMVLSRSAEGDEHVRRSLVGNVLLVSHKDIMDMTVVYTAVGLFHFLFRRQFFLISKSPEEAYAKGLRVPFWDFFFYVSFGIVVTSSVRIAGVLLVFSFLVVPALCAMLFGGSLKQRLFLGWAVGGAASLLGMAVSYFFDFPTGASVVCVFGGLLLVAALLRRAWR